MPQSRWILLLSSPNVNSRHWLYTEKQKRKLIIEIPSRNKKKKNSKLVPPIKFKLGSVSVVNQR